MGFYIEVTKNRGKAQQIVKLYGGRIVHYAPTFDDITQNDAIICVVDNGLFEAACFCHSQDELRRIWSGITGRPVTWVIMDRTKACELTGYVEGGE